MYYIVYLDEEGRRFFSEPYETLGLALRISVIYDNVWKIVKEV